MNTETDQSRAERPGLQRNAPQVAVAVLGTSDAVLAIVSWAFVLLISSRLAPLETLLLGAVAVIVQFAAGLVTGLYLRRVAIGSAAEFRLLVATSLVPLVAVLIVGLATAGTGALVEILLAWALTVVLAGTSRFLLRVWLDRGSRPLSGTPVVVVGASLVGTTLVEQMLRDKDGAYLPVAFVDDDTARRRFSFRGVRVRGTTSQLAEVIGATGAEGAVVAIGRADADLYADIAEQLSGTDHWVRTVPSAREMLGVKPGVGSIRDIDVADLIGRPTSFPDLTLARSMITGHRVLVTGAGGSIGSELCRQIHAMDPASLIMLDRDESALHALSMSLSGSALLDTPDFVLADIRDPEALDEVFARHRPEIVFHAAALKHLPMLESYPEEAWKTNVHGTQNVIAAARSHGVQRFVNVSTDKAADPTSVLGASKRVAEGLTASAAATTDAVFASVRFGNVIGSRGSAIPAFAEQIRHGGPVTVTDEDVTRYFMTIPEACALVLFACAVGNRGEILVLDMGSPVRIVDIARRMMALMDTTCPIRYTGLRHGEKLHEVLFTPDEKDVVGRHDRVFHVLGHPIDPASLPQPESDLDSIVTFGRSVLDGADTFRGSAALHPVEEVSSR